VPDVQRVRVDIVIHTLRDFGIAIEELAEERFGGFLLEYGCLRLHGEALLRGGGDGKTGLLRVSAELANMRPFNGLS
jgi:hypothetical protein